MKKISQQQIKAILDLLQKYNVGVSEYIAVQTLFDKAESVEETPVMTEKKD